MIVLYVYTIKTGDFDLILREVKVLIFLCVFMYHKRKAAKPSVSDLL